MSTQDENQRPVTIGDIKKLRKNWLQSSTTGLLYGGLFMIVLGVFSLFIPNTNGRFTLPFTILMFFLGISSIVLSFWGKKQAKKI